MSTRDEFFENAAAGARLLDIARPGWERDINLDDLNMYSWNACVLGQLFGAYTKGLDHIGVSVSSGFRYGFDAAISEGYPVLKQAWAKEVTDRLSQSQVASVESGDMEHIHRARVILSHVKDPEAREAIITYTLDALGRPEADRLLVRLAVGG